jgi:hypothetical protein
VCVCACMWVCMCVYVYVCIWVRVYLGCVCVYVYVCVCVCVCLSGKTLCSAPSCFDSDAANCVFNYGKRPAVHFVTAGLGNFKK